MMRMHPVIVAQAAVTAAVMMPGRFFLVLIGTAPDPDLVAAFEHAGGRRKPRYGQLTVSWARSDEEARRTAHEWWPNAGLPGLPAGRREHGHQAGRVLERRGATPRGHQQFVDAGHDHVYVHQVGPDQEGFFRFYETTVLPQLV